MFYMNVIFAYLETYAMRITIFRHPPPAVNCAFGNNGVVVPLHETGEGAFCTWMNFYFS